MCNLFIAVTPDTPERTIQYKLVLASNRDEYFHRPAEIADFWKQYPDIIGGRDMEKGREGGTWLAMSKSGKIGVLLNILNNVTDKTKWGRGDLVRDFLLSTDENGWQFSAKLIPNAKMYNDFNLVTLDVKGPEPEVTYFSSAQTETTPRKLNFTKTLVTAFGNSNYETPFKKVTDGIQEMSQLVDKFPLKSQKRHLVNGLKALLESKENFHPDPQIIKQVDDVDIQRGMSSRYVEIPKYNYGSRTHSVILVDFENNVEFHEWTMMEPIDQTSTTKRWIYSKFEFVLT